MIDKSILKQTALLISKELYLEQDEIGLPEHFDLLRERVVYVIGYLIDNDFEHLLNLLYIMDVDELKIRAVLNDPSILEPKYAIADIVIEREVQKVKTRIEYKQNKNEDDLESW